MIVVADTGPVNYLIRLGHIDLLELLYKSGTIPDGVIGEMLHPSAPAEVRLWASELPWWAVSASVSLSSTHLPPGLV